MPRVKDHRDVAINTLVGSTPTEPPKWGQFSVRFDSIEELEQSSVAREVDAGTVRETSNHQARIVDDLGRAVGMVIWQRAVTCNPLQLKQPGLGVLVDDWAPRGSGAPILPSRAPDRDAIWDDTPEVTCQLRLWVDAEQGFSATIAGDGSPYAIDLREIATGTTHSFRLDARLERTMLVLSRNRDVVRRLERQQPE
jgi:hypothetical protein